MVDLCHTSIYLEGVEATLRAVADEIKSNGIDSVIFDPLDRRPFKENDAEYRIEAEVVEIDGKAVLSVFVSSLDFVGPERWPEVDLSGAYFASHMIEADEHITNDVAGKYFKPYCVAIEDGLHDEGEGNAEAHGLVETSFETEAEAVGFVRDACPDVPENLETLDEIAAYFFAYDFDTLYSMRHLVWHCCLKVRSVCQPAVQEVAQCILWAVQSNWR